jgi:8-oxo-dGTP diphosphatase
MVREFGEETGLRVSAGPLLDRVGQFLLKTDGERVNNRSALFVARLEGEDPSLQSEPEHALVWVEPLQALARLRHGSHAWAVACWLRRGGA